MADRALENATARRDELAAKINSAQQQIDEWKRELARADAFIREWHAFAGTVVEGNSRAAAIRTLLSEQEVAGPRRAVRTNSKKEEVARQARELILERGQPILRSELYKLLTQERGLTIEGTDPDMVLSTMLWRMKDQVVRLKTGGYWLADQPYEPAGYDPSMEDLMEASDPNPPGELVSQYEEPDTDGDAAEDMLDQLARGHGPSNQ